MQTHHVKIKCPANISFFFNIFFFLQKLTWTHFLFCISIALDSGCAHTHTHTHTHTDTHRHNWLRREQSQLAPLVAVVTGETDFSRSTYSHPVCYSLVCSFIPPFSLFFYTTLSSASLSPAFFSPLSGCFSTLFFFFFSIPNSPPIRCPLSMHMQTRQTWKQLKKKKKKGLNKASGIVSSAGSDTEIVALQLHRPTVREGSEADLITSSVYGGSFFTTHLFSTPLLSRSFAPPTPPQLSPGCIRLSLANKAGNRKDVLPHRQNSGDTSWINTHTHTHLHILQPCWVVFFFIYLFQSEH